MHYIINKRICVCIVLLLGSLLPACTTDQSSIRTYADVRQEFRQARRNDDWHGMSFAVYKLAQMDVIKVELTENEVARILGRPDRRTEIYMPGGFSLGYGAGDPEGFNNHSSFFWLHFRAEDWNTSHPWGPAEPELLHHWDKDFPGE